jgi:hypothetical protein
VTEEDLYDWTLEPLLPVFLSLESKLESRRTFTLHDYLSPITFYYKLHAVDGVLVASHIDGDQFERRLRGVKLARSDPCFPCHRSSHRRYQYPIMIQRRDHPISEKGARRRKDDLLFQTVFPLVSSEAIS